MGTNPETITCPKNKDIDPIVSVYEIDKTYEQMLRKEEASWYEKYGESFKDARDRQTHITFVPILLALCEHNGILNLSIVNASTLYSYISGEYSNEIIFRQRLKEAENGDSFEQSYVGYCYDIGKGVEKNIKEAIYWYNKASNNGNIYGKYNLAMCYKNGVCVDINKEKAFILFKEANVIENADFQNNLAFCYENGFGTEKNYELAVFWYNKSRKNKSKLAIKWFEKAYKTTDKEEQYYLAINEIKNYGDHSLVISLLEKSKEQGNIKAVIKLGEIYFANKEYAKSFPLIKKVFDEGFKDTYYLLGMAYIFGQGVKQNKIEGLKLLEYIVDKEEKDIDKASFQLAKCYEEDNEFRKDRNKINKLYYLSIVNKGHNEALNLLQKDVEKGEPSALFFMYKILISSDKKTAMKYLLLSAKKYSVAQFTLGVLYERGNFVIKSTKKAVYYFTLASKNKDNADFIEKYYRLNVAGEAKLKLEKYHKNCFGQRKENKS